MITWEEHKWIIVAALLILLLVVLDELAYYHWRKVNPGALYSHLFGKKEISILDPSRPPTTIYYE